MIELNNIFNEDENFIMRFSTMVLFVFIYYSISYYFLIDDKIECLKKPRILSMIYFVFFHIIHVILLKVLYNNEMYAYSFILAILPILLYLLYNKYQQKLKKKEELKMKKLYDEFKKTKDLGGRNLNPQGPKAPPMGGTQYVGVHNNGMRRGDTLPYHQQQHNNPLPPTNPDYSMSGVPQIAMKENYDNDSLKNYRTNNTIIEPVQPMEHLDMEVIGGQAGSNLNFDGFDPYGSTLAMF